MPKAGFNLQAYFIQVVVSPGPSFSIRPSDLWKTPLCCVLWFKLWYWVKLIAPWETKGDYPDGLDRKMWPIMCGEKRLIKMSFKWTLLFFFSPEPLFAWSPPKTWIDQTHFIFPDYSPNWTIIEVCTTWSVI